MAKPVAKADSAALRDAVMERRKEVSSRVSETTRYIGFGLLATFYAMISGDDAFFVEARTHWPLLLRLIALTGSIAVLLDYLHYVFAYWSTERALERTDAPNEYGTGWFSYRGENACFWGKQAAAIIGCVLLVFLVGLSLS